MTCSIKFTCLHIFQSKTSVQSSIDERDSLSGRKPVRGRVPLRSESFHRQNVQRLAGLSCQREVYVWSFPLGCRSSTVHTSIGLESSCFPVAISFTNRVYFSFPAHGKYALQGLGLEVWRKSSRDKIQLEGEKLRPSRIRVESLGVSDRVGWHHKSSEHRVGSCVWNHKNSEHEVNLF
jgi:hypothetical protein